MLGGGTGGRLYVVSRTGKCVISSGAAFPRGDTLAKSTQYMTLCNSWLRAIEPGLPSVPTGAAGKGVGVGEGGGGDEGNDEGNHFTEEDFMRK